MHYHVYLSVLGRSIWINNWKSFCASQSINLPVTGMIIRPRRWSSFWAAAFPKRNPLTNVESTPRKKLRWPCRPQHSAGRLTTQRQMCYSCVEFLCVCVCVWRMCVCVVKSCFHLCSCKTSNPNSALEFFLHSVTKKPQKVWPFLGTKTDLKNIGQNHVDCWLTQITSKGWQLFSTVLAASDWRCGPHSQDKERKREQRNLTRPGHPWDYSSPNPISNGTIQSPQQDTETEGLEDLGVRFHWCSVFFCHACYRLFRIEQFKVRFLCCSFFLGKFYCHVSCWYLNHP